MRTEWEVLFLKEWELLCCKFPNIIKNPWIWLPPILASAILGPLSTTVFHMESNSVGSGMGTSGLVGQISTLAVMGSSSIPSMLLLHFFLPALLSYVFAQFLRRRNKIREGESDSVILILYLFV
ncbi:Predicted membrane protein, putative toxin regulator [Fusobacterium necrophorum subsp. necrophorum]|nr:Predicted membrane protein, putative toxin regulator [Fusobacterium necrophorum subsp. necrophorum]